MVQVKKLGWAGSAVIDGVPVLFTSASINNEVSPGFITMADINRDNVSRTKILYSDGTKGSSGSISFDMSSQSMTLFSLSRLLRRNYTFNVSFFDGEKGYSLNNCYVTNLSLSGSVGSLISGSLSFVSNEEKQSYSGGTDIRNTQIPLGYWYSGSGSISIIDWSFSFTQDAQIVYLNQRNQSDKIRGKYIKCGLLDYGLEITTYEQATTNNNIVIASSSFTITGITTSEEFSFNGQTDLGTYKYSFTSAGSVMARDNIIS